MQWLPQGRGRDSFAKAVSRYKEAAAAVCQNGELLVSNQHQTSSMANFIQKEIEAGKMDKDGCVDAGTWLVSPSKKVHCGSYCSKAVEAGTNRVMMFATAESDTTAPYNTLNQENAISLLASLATPQVFYAMDLEGQKYFLVLLLQVKKKKKKIYERLQHTTVSSQSNVQTIYMILSQHRKSKNMSKEATPTGVRVNKVSSTLITFTVFTTNVCANFAER